MGSIRDAIPSAPGDLGHLRTLGLEPPELPESEMARLHAAVHLAGHAVAAEACGLGYPELNLDAASAARCSYVALRTGSGHGPARNGVEAAIIASLAGIEAQRLAGGDPGAACVEVAPWLTDGESRDAEPYVEWLRLKAERTVEHPLRQRLILGIALALVEAGGLTSAQIEPLAARETALYMRGQ